MTPEMQLAQALGGAPDSTKEKLAEAFDEMSVEGLEGILKTALSAKTIGTAFGKRVKQVAEAQSPATKSALRSGGLKEWKAGKDVGKQVANAHPQYASWGDRNPVRRLAASFHAGGEIAKGASVSNTAALVADGVGRLMAKQATLLGAGLRMATRTPMATRAMVGAGVGAAGGAVKHMTSNNPNSTLGGSMLGGAALGAGAGAAAKAGAKALLGSGRKMVNGVAATGAGRFQTTGAGAYARKALGEANKSATTAATKAGTTGRQLALKPPVAATP